MTSDSSSSRAGEYVLGTLTKAERDAFEIDLARDRDLQAEVRNWERRLAPLADMITQERPSQSVWSAIEQRLDVKVDAEAEQKIVQLRGSLRLWQGLTFAASALAAGLVLFVLIGGRVPGVLPEQGYIAVVNRGGVLPALIVRVDAREGVVQVRSLSAEVPPDRSLELWYVGSGQAPKSLGVVEKASEPVAIPAAIRDSGIDGGSIAVTLEPKGGSPTGVATGPIVYSGKLIKEQP
jgi:anti-sigma-K factor RskA